MYQRPHCPTGCYGTFIPCHGLIPGLIGSFSGYVQWEHGFLTLFKFYHLNVATNSFGQWMLSRPFHYYYFPTHWPTKIISFGLNTSLLGSAWHSFRSFIEWSYRLNTQFLGPTHPRCTKTWYHVNRLQVIDWQVSHDWMNHGRDCFNTNMFYSHINLLSSQFV